MKAKNKFLRLIASIVTAFMFVVGITGTAACKKDDNKMLSDEKGIYTLDENGIKVYKVVMMDHGVPFTTKEFKYRQQVLERVNEKLVQDLGYKVDFNIEVYADDTFNDKLVTRLADQDQLDLVRQVAKENLDSYVSTNIAMDVTDYFNNESSLKSNLSSAIMKEVTYNGRVHAIPLDKLPVIGVTFVRGDLLNKAGYENLTSIEDWEGYLDKVVKGGSEYLNSKLQTVPLMGSLSCIEEMLYGAFTDDPGVNYINAEGKIRPKYFNEGYKNFIKKLREWMVKGYIDNSLFNFNEFGMNTYMSNQVTSAVSCGIYHLEFGSLLSVNKAHPEWNITPIMPLATEDGKYASTGIMGEFLFVPYSARSAGVVMDLLNWHLFNEENYMLLRCGIEGLTYTISPEKSIDVPAAEKSANVTAPSDLIGRFMIATSVKYNMGYPAATCPDGSKKAYSDSLKVKDEQLIVDPTIYVSSKISDMDRSVIASANNTVAGQIQKMLTLKKDKTFEVSDAEFDAVWNKMLKDYTGISVFDKMTEEYNKIK